MVAENAPFDNNQSVCQDVKSLLKKEKEAMMESIKKHVIGGRLDEMFEGELKLVFQNAQLQKSHEHRHSCGGKVALIVMEAGINAGAILTCSHCHWRKSFDPKLLNIGRHSELLGKIFRINRGSELTYYCGSCKEIVIEPTEEKCAGCLAKEAAHIDLPDDMKK